MRLYKHTVKVEGSKQESPRWYSDVYVKGRRYRLPLFSDKGTSRDFASSLNVLIGQYEAGNGYDARVQAWIGQLSPAMIKRLSRMGLVSQQRASGSKGINEHIADFEASLVASGCSAAHIAALVPRLERIAKGCGFTTLNDIDAGKIERFLSGLRENGEKVTLKGIDKETGLPKEVVNHISPVTYNYFIRAIRQFCQWLVDGDALHESPVRRLHKMAVSEDDQRRIARVLTVDELRLLIKTTSQATDWRGVSGKERVLIYLVANESGLRANEIRSLKVSDFDFEGCLIRVRGAISKNKKADVLPMKESTAAMLKEFIGHKDPSSPALTVLPEAFRMIKHDLKLAGIPYQTDEGTAHFHSLRHGFATRLDSVVLRGSKTAVDLMRHGDARLTLSRYTHGLDERERQAIDALPNLIESTIEEKKKA